MKVEHEQNHSAEGMTGKKKSKEKKGGGRKRKAGSGGCKISNLVVRFPWMWPSKKEKGRQPSAGTET